MVQREKVNDISVCGMITLYSPPESLFHNISTYIDYIEKLYIVDNSVDDNDNIYTELLHTYPKVEIVASGKNIGVAAALNLCIAVALQNKYQWMLTMDQDSFFDADQAKHYFCSLTCIDNKKKVALLSPSHERVLMDSDVCVYQQKEVVMTSGNLLNLLLVNDIGLFNEDLFIDSVDHDYCLRAHILGLDVLQAKNCFIQHEVGRLYSSSLLFGYRKRIFYIHSPKRMYFIVRNSLYMGNKYRKTFPEFIKKQNKAVFEKISKSIRYSDKKTTYMKYIIKAYIDYYFNKYGNQINL